MERAAWTREQKDSFRGELLSWFQRNARDLPWRRTHDPYRIWISEVMLQQTRVATVIDRYNQFMRRFPSLVSLALAREDDVLALWSGLGYYKRARLLHDAARLLVNEHGGSLPRTSIELRRLPGVGDYTAAAIASIAYGEPVAVVDGNVERVVSRLLALGTAARAPSAARLKQAAGELLAANVPGAFNQAMMELGATICLPRAPLCTGCPVNNLCSTRGEHVTRSRKQMVSRKVSYGVARRPLDGEGSRCAVLLVKRLPNAAHMPGMWELPALLGPTPEEEPMLRVRHSITTTNYYVAVFELDYREPVRVPEGVEQQWVPDRKLNEIPLTGLARKILMRLDVLARPRHVRQGKALPGSEEQLV